MSFLGEIKRRKVFQVAAVYAVVAWLLIQVVDIVSGPLNLPDWINAVVIVLLAVGFPIAVILAWAFDLTPQGVRADSEIQASSGPAQPGGQRLNYLLQLLVLLAVGFLVLDQYLLEPQAGSTSNASAADGNASRSVVRLTIAHADSEPIGQNTFDSNIAISRDGQHIAYIAGDPRLLNFRLTRLYLRALDTLEPTLLSETARGPFFSLNGQWVGFVDGGWHLAKIARTGGPAVPITDISGSLRGASWAADDTIIYGAGGATTGLFRISAAGGEPELLTTPDTADGEGAHLFPQLLPGERAVLFTILNEQEADNSQIAVLDLETNEYRILIQGGHQAHYTESGHIVYGVAGTLRAVPFDLESLEVRGVPIPVLDGVATKQSGAASFAVSDNGTLVYLTGGAEGEILRATFWVDREGREEPFGLAPCRCNEPAVSPDDTRVAFVVGVQDETDSDIWIWSLAQRRFMRLTSGPGEKSAPVWSPDGEQIAYLVDGEGFFSRMADGTGAAELLFPMTSPAAGAFSWSADNQLIIQEGTGFEGFDITLIDLTGSRERRTLLDAEFSVARPKLSPDGRWLAYESYEYGRAEVFVRPFPNVEDGWWQISNGGGSEPKWAADGQTLFFRKLTDVMAVPVQADATVPWGTPELVLEGRNYISFGNNARYDVSPDGQRFLMLKEDVSNGTREPPQIVVVQNWFEELSRLAPPSE